MTLRPSPGHENSHPGNYFPFLESSMSFYRLPKGDTRLERKRLPRAQWFVNKAHRGFCSLVSESPASEAPGRKTQMSTGLGAESLEIESLSPLLVNPVSEGTL